MEEQDVHDDRAEQGKTQGNVASDQEQQTSNDLQQADDVHVMALHERFAEVSSLCEQLAIDKPPEFSTALEKNRIKSVETF